MLEKERTYFAKEYLELGIQLQLDGKIEEAIKTYKKSIEFLPTAEAHTHLGWAYSVKQNYNDAIDECLTAITLNPDFGNSYNDIGSYLIQLGRETEAVEWLEKAIRAPHFNPRHLPYFHLGRIFEKQGKWKIALEKYNQSLTVKPDFFAAKNSLFRITALLN